MAPESHPNTEYVNQSGIQAAPVPPSALDPQVDAAPVAADEDLEDLNKEELVTLAEARGVDSSGTKDEIKERLRS